MVELSGKCLCGQVRWTYKGEVTRNLICHCESCQRATSSPFTAFVGLQSENIKWSGAFNDYESSPQTWRAFCPNCGSRLYFKSGRWPGETHIHAATLDDPKPYQGDRHVLWAERMPWLEGIFDLPKTDGFDRIPGGTKEA